MELDFGTRWSVPVLISVPIGEAIQAAGGDALDAFLAPYVAEFDRQYRVAGTPSLIADAAGNLIAAIEPYLSDPSLEHARLLGLHGRMLVAAGEDRACLVHAEQSLAEALIELESLHDWTRETVKSYVDSTLVAAVTKKATGQREDAIHLLRDTLADQVLSRYRTDQDVISLIRQDVMMAGTIHSHYVLADQAGRYRKLDPAEYYGSVKRIFEFVLNAGDRGLARRVYSWFTGSFEPLASSHASLLSRVSFVKNCAQYKALTGELAEARELLDFARELADGRGFLGQQRQIDGLTAAVDAGESPHLETFRVG